MAKPQWRRLGALGALEPFERLAEHVAVRDIRETPRQTDLGEFGHKGYLADSSGLDICGEDRARTQDDRAKDGVKNLQQASDEFTCVRENGCSKACDRFGDMSPYRTHVTGGDPQIDGNKENADQHELQAEGERRRVIHRPAPHLAEVVRALEDLFHRNEFDAI